MYLTAEWQSLIRFARLAFCQKAVLKALIVPDTKNSPEIWREAGFKYIQASNITFTLIKLLTGTLYEVFTQYSEMKMVGVPNIFNNFIRQHSSSQEWGRE